MIASSTSSHDSRPSKFSSDVQFTILIAAAYVALFCWVYWRAIVEPIYLAESDLYEYFLPIFLSPFTIWSSFEYSGVPSFADIDEPFGYPIYLVFAKVFHSWVGYVIAAHAIGAIGVYAYVCRLTRSRATAAFAGLAFSLSEAMIERVAHMTALHVIAWIPWVFLSLEGLREKESNRWVAASAAAIALMIHAGHPQPTLYGCLAALAYASVGGVVEGKSRRYWGQVVAAFVVAAALAAVKVLPFLELMTQMARDEVSYSHFVSRANSPVQMWSALFPTIVHDGREAPTYVGLGALLFAWLGAAQWRRSWQVKFWVSAVVIAGLFGMGDATPLARFAYDYVPTYDKFRVGARHLILFCLGLSVLAGIGLGAALDRSASRRSVFAMIGVFLGTFAIGLWIIRQPFDGLAFENRQAIQWARHGLPAVVSDAVWTQAAIAVATLAAATATLAARRKTLCLAVLSAVLIVDLLNAQPFAVSARGVDSIAVPRTAATPSVHATAIAQTMASEHQRYLALAGTTREALVPATWARIWQIPIAGGYGPMLLARHSLLGAMGRDGAPRGELLGGGDQALNLLAVRMIAVQPQDVASSGITEAGGIPWEKQPLDLTVGPPECRVPHERRLTLHLPQDVDVSTLHAVMYLRCAEDVPQGTEVGALTLVSADGTRDSRPLRAGVEISEAALADQSVRARSKHTPAALFSDPDSPGGLRSLVTVQLPSPTRVRQLEITSRVFEGWIALGRLTLVDPSGKAFPQSTKGMFLRDPDHWRLVRRIYTSRITDRDRDEDASGESEYALYENRQALPRAWMASSVDMLPLKDVLAAIRTGQLSNGSPFDPRRVALVAREDGAPSQTSFGTGSADVRLTDASNGRVAMTVSSDGGGFVVVSETYYPGWRATIDGAPAPVFRADFSLQGTVVPPGRHEVIFTFVPRLLYVGAALSLAGVLALAALCRVESFPFGRFRSAAKSPA